MTGVELLQNGIGRTLGFLGRAGAMISITLLSRAEDEPEYQEHCHHDGCCCHGE